jgi:catechol 2,3-dioxygenase-like lactoylglutathione lyase family enzyme
MAIGKFRCIVMNVTDLEQGERFWTAITGLPVRFSAVGYPTRFSRLGDIASHSILLQLVSDDRPPPTNNAHLDLTVEDVDAAVQGALQLGATLTREKGTYPVESSKPYLEWAVMKDPFGNAFCLIRDLTQ